MIDYDNDDDDMEDMIVYQWGHVGTGESLVRLIERYREK
jgi:hypothetical protein